MRIVILRALKLGDFITGIPAFRAVRAAYPDARIVLATPNHFAGLAALLDGAIDEIADTSGLAPIPEAGRDADIGIDLHGKGPESQRLLLDARIRRLIAFRHPLVCETSDGPEHDDREHEVSRWCRLLRWYGIAADPSDLDLRRPAIDVPTAFCDATLVHPGAASQSRRWPVDRWIAIVRAEHAIGRRVVITGDASERHLTGAIATGADVPESHVLAGKTSLTELAAIVANAGRVVCGDSGVAHLATAYRRPSVVLFGPTPPSTWGPPERPIHRVLWNGTTGDPHGDTLDPGLGAITTERVLAALRALPTAKITAA